MPGMKKGHSKHDPKGKAYGRRGGNPKAKGKNKGSSTPASRPGGGPRNSGTAAYQSKKRK